MNCDQIKRATFLRRPSDYDPADIGEPYPFANISPHSQRPAPWPRWAVTAIRITTWALAAFLLWAAWIAWVTQ